LRSCGTIRAFCIAVAAIQRLYLSYWGREFFMKKMSGCLIASGLLFAIYGLSAIGEPGFDLVRHFASGDAAAVSQIASLALGLVLLVVGIAGVFPDAQNDIARAEKKLSSTDSNAATNLSRQGLLANARKASAR
jgi:uncharacterized membrane protein